MNIYSKKRLWKLLLLLSALMIALASLWYTNNLVSKLAVEEEKKVELVAEATRQITSTTDFSTDLSFAFTVIQGNNTVPVILIDKDRKLQSFRNLDKSDSIKILKDDAYLEELLQEMEAYHEPITIKIADDQEQYIYFKPSILIDLLVYYPYIQLSIVSIFILIAYLAFSSSRNAEQNQVWVGMSKETAHQLGTPLSSLSGWLEILKSKGIEEDITQEIQKDISRLEVITNRFSKIGSQPILSEYNFYDLLSNSVKYLERRLSKNVEITFDYHLSKATLINVNKELFEWVIENLSKNAADAMDGSGKLSFSVQTGPKGQIFIDIADTGKGIAKSEHKKVFKPGFTSKKRGWGLGLSLVKRIIEQYHFGKVYIKESEIGKGTIFRMSLYPEKLTKTN